ncbi:MAG TPA: glycosyltransferase, partial [Thermodesulfobacteriota bacterium]|nr:glycosyltransferase [Thermodesulfobacteriota bacterium]
MRIMTAMYTLRKGGAYDRFVMMLEAFLERNCEIHCLSLSPIQIKHSLFHNHVMYFPFKEMNSFIAKLAVLSIFPPWAIWIVWRHKIDHIIAFGSLYAFIQGLAKWLLSKTMVTFIRGNSSFGLKTQNSPKWAFYLNNLIESTGLHFSDRVITNNAAIRKEILSVRRRRQIDVQVLYNNIPPINIREPIDVARTRNKYGIPENAKVLVTAGVLNRGKNIEILVKCAPKIEIENVCVLVVGDSSKEPDLLYRDSLRKLAKVLGVDKQVLFTGWLEKEDLWKIYLASDLFVLPSLSEGMPNALLEALGLNLACMGSWIPGIKDILQYEELMFDPRDEEAISDKVNRFFSDKQHATRILRLCQERKKDFVFDWQERAFQMVTQ